jgi:hypothetical protein
MREPGWTTLRLVAPANNTVMPVGNFHALTGAGDLAKLVRGFHYPYYMALPIAHWRYKSDTYNGS